VKDHHLTPTKHSEFDHRSQCRCGWTTDPKKVYRTRQMVEDEERRHLDEVARVRLHLKGKHTTLEGEKRHAEKMMNDVNVPLHDRGLWRILYEDLAARCGHKPTPEEQPELALGLDDPGVRKPNNRT
jgi:hypothetical protein